MTPNVLKAYKTENYKVNMGCPEQVFSVISNEKEKRTLTNSGGLTVTDSFVFSMISKIFEPDGIFIIGNSFGLSTFILADLFPNSEIDVIDAELEGLDVKIGSELTKKLASDFFKNVKLTVGFSPNDLSKSMRRKKYNFFFIDGLHTDEQILLDFEGILPYCDNECVLYFHDVVSCNMLTSWEIIKNKAQMLNFVPFELGFTQMGCTVLVRGNDDLIEYFSNASNPFVGPYKIGFNVSDLDTKLKRPWFWDLSFGHLEKVIKRKLKRIFN